MSYDLPPDTTPIQNPLINFNLTSSAMPPPPPPKKDSEKDFRMPKLRLEVRDLNHPGAALYFSSVNTVNLMTTAVRNIQRLLYTSPSTPNTSIPATRSVTLILRDMDGVAYTAGSELDNDHKEIHLSMQHVKNQGNDRAKPEIWGVITHELVHCFQYNGHGACPGGLIEGIADWVRLRCDLKPPHWSKQTDGNWDGGYEKTAFFLDYIEEKHGAGSVQKINEALRKNRYEEDKFWKALFGKGVKDLWKEYVEHVKKSK